MTTYKRLLRRQAGADVQTPGPWHAMQEGDIGLTWCGRRLRGMNWQRTETPTGQPQCGACLTAKSQGRPHAYRRRR